MKHTVRTYVKWSVSDEYYAYNEYKYYTKEEAIAGFKEISNRLAELISNNQIVDFQIEM